MRTREIYFTPESGLKLTKRFGKIDKIVLEPFGDITGVTVSVPETAIDRLVQSLLELKVLMKDGSDYNSGFMRLAIVDGSGLEIKMEDLNDNGKENARHLAEQFIEELHDLSDDYESESEEPHEQ